MRIALAYICVDSNTLSSDYVSDVDHQKSIIMEYCSKNDTQISDWLIDTFSSVGTYRPQLSNLLYSNSTNLPVEAVIVAKSDYLTKDIRLFYYYMMLLEKKGLKLISATEDIIDDGSGLGNVYKSLMLFVAEQERQHLKMRTTLGRKDKASRGGYCGGKVPYGYKALNHSLQIYLPEAEIVKLIFQLKDQENTTYRDIVKQLNARGYVNRSGGQWSVSSVQSIYENKKVYLGYYKYGKDGEWVKGEQEPILKEEQDADQ